MLAEQSVSAYIYQNANKISKYFLQSLKKKKKNLESHTFSRNRYSNKGYQVELRHYFWWRELLKRRWLQNRILNSSLFSDNAAELHNIV